MERPDRQKKRLWIAIPIVVAVWIATSVAMGLAPSAAMGLQSDGRVAGCPDSPNCVSTTDERPNFAVEPIDFQVAPDAALKQAKEALQREGGKAIEDDGAHYLRATFVTPVLRFRDDVEIAIHPLEKQIHIRSASRLGYSDLGVNRKRAERLRSAISEGLVQTSPEG